jgi:hypothetical protein
MSFPAAGPLIGNLNLRIGAQETGRSWDAGLLKPNAKLRYWPLLLVL